MMTMQSALDRYYDFGRAKGTKNGRFESIILLMHTMSLSEEKAKKALCFPVEDTAAFAEWKQENTEWINSVMEK